MKTKTKKHCISFKINDIPIAIWTDRAALCIDNDHICKL